MSNIALVSPATGTATFSITTPSGTSTDRTLTLPDTTAPILAGSGITLSASAPANTLVTDASGNVGIGTSSPGAKLEVNGAIRSLRSGSTAAVLQLINDNNSWNITSGTTTAQFRIDNNLLGTALTIDSSGNLLVGTTSALGTGKVGILHSTFDNNGLVIRTSSTTYNTGSVIFQNSSGSNAGFIQITGASSVSYVTSSDYRLKHDIQPMTGALAKVAQLKPVTYKWNADDSQSQGFIAHELQEVVPECVTGEKDAVDADGNPQYQGIDTSFLVATLTAAIQELNAKVDAQAAEIAALKGQA